jgi:hypothetical protein
MLRVSKGIATDYLARLVVRHLGHAVLPKPRAGTELLHDAAMIHALGIKPERGTGFASIVHREAGDPFFFLEAPDILDGVDTARLSAGQRFLYQRFLDQYDPGAMAGRYVIPWGLDRLDSDDPTEARRYVRGVLEEARQAGFAF